MPGHTLSSQKRRPIVNDEDAFRQQIQATPDDDTLRAVFADWLEERGRTDEAAAQRNWKKSVKWLKKFVAEDGRTRS